MINSGKLDESDESNELDNSDESESTDYDTFFDDMMSWDIKDMVKNLREENKRLWSENYEQKSKIEELEKKLYQYTSNTL